MLESPPNPPEDTPRPDESGRPPAPAAPPGFTEPQSAPRARRLRRRPVPPYSPPTGCRRVVLPFLGFIVDADDDHRKRVERFFQVPMLILSLLVLPLLAVHYYFAHYLENVGLVDLVDIVFAVISVAFLVEFLVKVTIAKSRTRYCLTNWLDIVIIVLPFLRPLRAARAARVVQISRAYSLRGLYVKIARTGVAFVLGTEFVRRLRERHAKAVQRPDTPPDYAQWSRASLIAEIGRLREELEMARLAVEYLDHEHEAAERAEAGKPVETPGEVEESPSEGETGDDAMAATAAPPAPPVPGWSFRRRLLLSTVAIAAATAIWMPLLHFVFQPRAGRFRSETAISPVAQRLAQRHLDLWASTANGQADVQRMRINNPEWDFMGRTFLVLSLANMALHAPEQQADYLAYMDRIIDDTDRLVRQKGVWYFLMSYAGRAPFQQQPVRSIFVDGELALMLGARRLVQDRPDYATRMGELVHITTERMAAGPVLSCESYPDECWTYCNAIALASVRMHEVLDSHDHAQLRRDWVTRARKRLVHPRTGLLGSKYTYEGEVLDGPEGSTIWMVAHCLQLVDREFAADQYARARQELCHERLGFGWAGEWPQSWVGPMDVDSGPVIPILDVSAGSSGQAFVAAAAFGDEAFFRELATTLMFAGFPLEQGGRLRFCASNQVGDAVLLYSTVVGPLWKRVEALDRPEHRSGPTSAPAMGPAAIDLVRAVP